MPSLRPSSSDSDQPAALVRAARVVIARDGIGAATTRRIAAEADVPLGALYYWFATKDALLEEVVLAHVREIEAAVAVAARAVPDDPGQTPHATAMGLLRTAVGVVKAAPASESLLSYELTAWAMRTPGMQALAQRQTEAVRQATAAAVSPWLARYATDGGAVAEADLAQFLAALLTGLVWQWATDPDGADPDAVLELASRLVSDAVAVTAAGAPAPGGGK